MSGTFPSTPAPRHIKLRSITPTMISVSHSLKRMARSRGTQRWALDLEFPPMQRDYLFTALWAFLVKQRGQFETFTYVLPAHLRTGTWAGSPMMKGAGQTGRVLNCDGFTPGATVYAGDWLKFQNHSKVYLCTANNTANGAGELTLSIEPALVTSPADNELVISADVPFTVALASDSAEYSLEPGQWVPGLDVTLVEIA